MGIWGDIIIFSFLHVGLFFIFFSPNICSIGGENSKGDLELESNNNYNDKTPNWLIRVVRDDNFRHKVSRSVSTNGLTSTDSPKLVKPTTTVLPGCESGSLDVCEKMQPVAFGLGIPATPAAVEKACKAFDLGMDCYYTWARRCIKEEQMQKFNTSILGAHEIFTFLCRDPVFKKDYLLHNKCYQKISKRWDECATKFIEVLKSPEINIKDDSDVQICCLRYGFIHCVMQITYSKCAAEDATAVRFVQQMAETVLRSRMQSHSPEQCNHIKPDLNQHCASDSTAPNSKLPWKATIVIIALLVPVLTILVF